MSFNLNTFCVTTGPDISTALNMFLIILDIFQSRMPNKLPPSKNEDRHKYDWKYDSLSPNPPSYYHKNKGRTSWEDVGTRQNDWVAIIIFSELLGKAVVTAYNKLYLCVALTKPVEKNEYKLVYTVTQILKT